MPRRRLPDHTEQVDRLLSQATTLSHGPTRVELCEEAVRVADLHNDTELAYRARQELIDAACFGGRPDLLIVAYTWCLAKFDRGDGIGVSGYHVLWRMKWVAGALPRFPEISLATIRGTLDDMERRFREFGGSVQPVVAARRSVALQTGDLDAARRYHRQFARMPRTLLSNCPACEEGAAADYLTDTGRTAQGVKRAEELIASGMRCAKVPDGTYADVLLPMVQLGRAREAMPYHKKGYPLIRRSAADLSRSGAHMLYLALTGNDARAVKLLERHLPDLEASHDPLSSLSFLRCVMTLAEVLADRKPRMTLRLPAESPLADPSGEYDMAALAASVRQRALERSRRFDGRNGNTYYEELVTGMDRLRKKATNVPYAS